MKKKIAPFSSSLLSFRLDPLSIFAMLFAVFLFAYVVPSYWQVFKSPIADNVAFIALVGIGAIWAIAGRGRVQFQIARRDIWALGLIALLLFVFNVKPLFSVIPWRGDEDYHIRITLEILNGLSPRWVALLLFMAFAMTASSWVGKKWIVIGLAVVLVLLGYFFSLHHPIRLGIIIRYPFLLRWAHVLFPLVLRYFTPSFLEFSYRIIPFLSTALLCWIYYLKADGSGYPKRLIWAITVGTLPIVWYYTSICYLEMTAVVLMAIACFGMDELLHSRFSEIRKHPSWIALILTGFIKETTFPFLCAFLVSRMLIRIRLVLKKRIRPKELLDDLKIALCTFTPLVIYLAFRRSIATVRPFETAWANLLEFKIYPILLVSFLRQFGLYFLLFVAGCIALLKKKSYSILLFIVLSCMAIPLFHIVDHIKYTGYSRFNLFLIPVFSMGAFAFIRAYRKFNPYLPILVIACNVALSPLNLDGTKKPFWGNTLCDVSEHYYPYDQAILWCKKHHFSDKLLFTGLYYPYLTEFYFYKYQWYPESKMVLTDEHANDLDGLQNAFQIASREQFPVIVYHVLGQDIPQTINGKGYALERVIRNRAHVLVIYSISPANVKPDS